MDEQNMIEQEEQEMLAQSEPGTLLSDTVPCPAAGAGLKGTHGLKRRENGA